MVICTDMDVRRRRKGQKERKKSHDIYVGKQRIDRFIFFTINIIGGKERKIMTLPKIIHTINST